ncbi:PAAR domain-containing protein [Paraburkholderia sp. D15]|uniref:PAAR domain-containing protein n=1 Tax=Paraburkholderia sp. D15 TaxID=2880218 RepID=UPI00247AFF69|nr:PAAR domain-containing protein [Paraburkholderia sp. D15]WGS49975.1 PAAR domain-containing protein [Paraburkholderia sp. D15]WKF57890.1 hypothetical protein HUO10_002384 [Paraburkholderia busanensis]
MARPFIVLGDKHSHGGTVTSAAVNAKIAGKNIARRNDKVSCPIHGPNHITDGDDTAIVENEAVARDGYKTACGATLIASQTTTGGA